VIGDVTLGKEVPSEVRKESQLRVGGEVSPLASIYNQEFTKWASAYGGGPKFHASLCDVPFGIGFMGKDWDSAGGPAAYQTLAKKWGEAMLPLLYPGALVFMFGGTRTWHRLACGMEDAGFEMFDTVMWVHAQGFPKAQDIGGMVAKATGEKPIAEVRNPAFIFQKNSGQTSTGWEGVIPETKKIFANPWQGYKTPALKPAHEPILCLRAPRQRMIYAELARRHGTGALNVDAARIGKGARKWDKPKGGIWHPSEPGEQRFIDNPLGRYPANVIFDEESAKRLDAQSGVSKSRRDAGGQSKKGGDIYLHGMESRNGNAHSDEGGASRFFYVAKASKKERNAGCEDLPNDHPCVKPLDLCRYLATLLLPPPSVEPRRILVPFAGSGSEMIGAMLAGWDEVVGIEQNPHYCEIAKRRLQYWQMAVRPSSSKRKDAA
jgi:site-specific DNA-methyltransferase (adenine-specific)